MRQTGFAQVNDTRLYYEVAGAGSVVVLIHGHSFDTRMWDDQFETFAQHYRVVRYDMRGYGQSAAVTAQLYTATDDLMALMQYLGIRHDHLLGLSRGGGVAVDFALTYPQAVDSLILVDASLGGFQWTDFGTSASEVKAAWRTGGDEAARQRWLADALFAPALRSPVLAARLRQMVSDYASWRRWGPDDPVRPLDPPAIHRLDRITVPTLIMVGQLDLPDFHAIAETLQRGIPHARSVVLPSVGHLANMEDPEQFNQTVLGFLADLDG